MKITSVEDIGLLIRTARKKAGLTQADLAGASGTGVRFIVDLENGKPTSQIGKVLHILKMLGLKVDIQ